MQNSIVFAQEYLPDKKLIKIMNKSKKYIKNGWVINLYPPYGITIEYQDSLNTFLHVPSQKTKGVVKNIRVKYTLVIEIFKAYNPNKTIEQYKKNKLIIEYLSSKCTIDTLENRIPNRYCMFLPFYHPYIHFPDSILPILNTYRNVPSCFGKKYAIGKASSVYYFINNDLSPVRKQRLPENSFPTEEKIDTNMLIEEEGHRIMRSILDNILKVPCKNISIISDKIQNKKCKCF